ncbi:MAG: helix-turn-helix transcriptional regulator [Desulfovibrio sp.]|uniref:helix-turn-helix transcriptional regulator n=1 Tax=Desulfovibrio sp. 7SRBS1 TaxID=3378064 RepID=UPI003B409088
MIIHIDHDVLMDFLNQVLGKNYEIVFHDISDGSIENSVVAIRNGHVTGRVLGSSATGKALSILKKHSGNTKNPYEVNYVGIAQNGKKLRSSTLLLHDPETEKPSAMLCMNIDETPIYQIKKILDGFLVNGHSAQDEESFNCDIQSYGENRMEEILLEYPGIIRHMSSEEKLRIIQKMDKAGIFLIKGFVAKVADKLEISEPTLYRYLKQIEKGHCG